MRGFFASSGLVPGLQGKRLTKLKGKTTLLLQKQYLSDRKVADMAAK